LGTSREHNDNMLRIHWNKEEKTKNNSPHLTPPPKGKTGPIMSAC